MQFSERHTFIKIEKPYILDPLELGYAKGKVRFKNHNISIYFGYHSNMIKVTIGEKTLKLGSRVFCVKKEDISGICHIGELFL